MGIISLDLNGLKVNNDYLGHERGDYILKKLADNLKTVMDSVKEKEIARIGGDEFLIVIPNTNKDALATYKNDILNACKSDDIEEFISVSLGIAYNDSKDLSVYQLVHEADQEMYLMKDKTSDGYKEKMIEHIKMQNKFIR